MKNLLYILIIFQMIFGAPLAILAQEFSSSTPEILEETTDTDIEVIPEATSTESILDEIIINEPTITSVTTVGTTTELDNLTLDSVGKFVKEDNLSQAEQLKKVRQFLIKNNLTEALERLDQFEAEQKKPQAIEMVDQDKLQREAEEFAGREPFKVETFEGEIEKRDVKDFENDFSQASKDVILNLVSDNPNDYLAEGNEIMFSQAIKDKADELGNDPLRIFNFVRNNVTYVPYYGSKKGSDATLVELAGNDMDKASLMIAMLRYSDIPARYRHVNAKMDIRTVTDLLGVETADAAAEVLTLHDIPVSLYTLDGEPSFFVVEHTYVEAYIPYGYSRGATTTDGGVSQWVPMDPSINSYYYEQLVDVVDHMKSNGFVVETFFDDYLNNQYGSATPLEAFRNTASTTLHNFPPTYYPNMAYDDALTKSYPKQQNLEFIPGTLPYEISTNIDTYDFIPTLYRHTLKFTVKDKNDVEVLNKVSYLSDIADRELLMTYDAATPADQTTINSFSTIYDVVPLSLVSVRPVIKVNGQVIASSSVATTLGQKQTYIIEFAVPNGNHIGDPIQTKIVETYDKSTLSGGSEAIALNTGRVIPPELRPTEDTTTTSYVNDQLLYSTALDYLNRLQYSHDELAEIIGADFTHTATKASVFNGITVTNSGGVPYSFSWNGLRIDAFSLVKYYNRFHNEVSTHRKEFFSVFGLQSSLDESTIFEQNFDVESVSTVKGLKLVNQGTFPNTTMLKITSQNESQIDTLNIPASTKSIFHSAVQGGKTIYTPTAPVTYGAWTGLFYIMLNPNNGTASYTIGEGLNGGYTSCSMPGVSGALCNWTNNTLNILIPKAQASGVTANVVVSKTSIFLGESFNAAITYVKQGASWIKNLFIKPEKPGKVVVTAQNATNSATATTTVKDGSDVTTIDCSTTLEGRVISETEGMISEEMHLPLFIDKKSGVYQDRFNGYKQYNKQDDIYSHSTSPEFIRELKGAGNTTNNINNPWIDPITGKYWNMSIDYAAFSKPAVSIDHEKYYINMRWHYTDFPIPARYAEQAWYFGKKVWIKNPATKKAVLAGALDFGPAVNEGAAGASPEVLKTIGAKHDDEVEFCWATDQNIKYGKTLSY